jgi:hypothetical protein
VTLAALGGDGGEGGFLDIDDAAGRFAAGRLLAEVELFLLIGP